MSQRLFSYLILSLFLLLLSSCQQEPFPQGRILYENFCLNCHMADGTGLAELIPPLAQSDYLQNNNLATVCIIRYGQEGKIIVNGRTYENPMPGVDRLSDFEITNIINYINQAWGNEYGYIKLADVRQQLTECQPPSPTDN